MKRTRNLVLGAALAAILPAGADIAISVNDGKAYLENGVAKTAPAGDVDHIVVLDMSVMPPKIKGRVDVPTTEFGPPVAVAITRDESLALVTCARKRDPADGTKTIADNRVSVIDLKAKPPRLVATVEAGAGASGASINRAGTLALVANRDEGTVSIFTIKGTTVTPAGKVKLGDEKSGPSHVVFTPDGKRALVTRYGDQKISLLSIDGAAVTDAKRDIGVGSRPYGADISSDGSIAVVANVGRSQGDMETVTLVDMRMNPPRVVDTVSVPDMPEGITLAPDGKHVAVVTHNGSTKPGNSPFYNEKGKVVLLKIDKGRLSRVAEAPIARWAQGSVFSRDGKHLIVQNMTTKELAIFKVAGDKLTDTGQRVKLESSPVSMRTSW